MCQVARRPFRIHENSQKFNLLPGLGSFERFAELPDFVGETAVKNGNNFTEINLKL
jgi:hypothetical protein